MATTSIQTDISFDSKYLARVSLTSPLDASWLKRLFSPSIHFTSFSPSSDRLAPQVILHTICENGVIFKVAPASQHESPWTELKAIHNSCLSEKKSMFVQIEGKELHLVATHTARSEPCFWAYVCRIGQYSVCCSMLNQRTLALVFDLDETLIIANTMKSFDDRITSAERKLRVESDPDKQAQYAEESAILQRDKELLKDYMDRNKVKFEGEEFEAQFEEAPSAINPGVILQRPLIRLPNGVILTRINPTNRDTSVLVKLRPHWEDLREYILTKGRKRFETFVCTLSEKEYAWEVWRLLDPGAKLIDWGSLKQRVACVRPDIKKSLVGVFSAFCCNPGMSIVIDDRLKVWEEDDQSRVHVVPQYAPYSSPSMEWQLEPRVMHVVRNTIYNARAAFFKYLDEDLVQATSNLSHETDPKALPARPDVSTFLKAEPSFPLGPVSANGLTGPEERELVGKGVEPNFGEDSITKEGIGAGDSTAEVSSPGKPRNSLNGAEKGGTTSKGDKDAPSDGSGEEESSIQEANGKEVQPQDQKGPPRTVSDTQPAQEPTMSGQLAGPEGLNTRVQNAVSALSNLSSGQQVSHEQLGTLLAAAPLLLNAAPQLAAILPRVQALFNLQQQQQQGLPPIPPGPPPSLPPPVRTPANPPLPPGPPPPKVVEQARAGRPPAPAPFLPPGFGRGGVPAQPPLPPGARPPQATAASKFQQQIQAMKQTQEERQHQLKEQRMLLQAQPHKGQPRPGCLPSPPNTHALPSPRGVLPGHVPALDNRPPPLEQTPDQIHSKGESKELSENDEESGDDGFDDDVSEEGSERARARAQQEADAAAQGGVEEGEFLDEEEGTRGEAEPEPSSRGGSAEPMEESSDGEDAIEEAGISNEDKGASRGDDEPSSSGGEGSSRKEGGAASESRGGDKDVLPELHAFGKALGKDVTYKFSSVGSQGSAKLHLAQVLMGGQVAGEGRGPSKRQAKIDGAQKVLQNLRTWEIPRPPAISAPPLLQAPNHFFHSQPSPTPQNQPWLPAPGGQNPSQIHPLQEVRYVYHGQDVEFEELASEGPPHRRRFTYQVKVNGIPVAAGSGSSKKAAKQLASEEAIRRKPLIDQRLQLQAAQSAPPRPPSLKRPPLEVEPASAPASKRGRTSEDPPAWVEASGPHAPALGDLLPGVSQPLPAQGGPGGSLSGAAPFPPTNQLQQSGGLTLGAAQGGQPVGASAPAEAGEKASTPRKKKKAPKSGARTPSADSITTQ